MAPANGIWWIVGDRSNELITAHGLEFDGRPFRSPSLLFISGSHNPPSTNQPVAVYPVALSSLVRYNSF
jgi:hypothetical protein